MSSPVYQDLSFMILNKNESDPVYLQFVNQFIQAIQEENLLNGEQILGTRKLSEKLSINRNTIVKALSELEMQGWIEVKPNIGTFVINKSINANNKIKADFRFPKISNFNFNQSFLYDILEEDIPYNIMLDDGKIDHRLIDFKTTSKYYSSLLKRKNILNKNLFNNNQYFIKHLINYINSTRNLGIDHTNLLVTKSHEMSLQLLSKILLKPGENIAVNELSHFKVNMIFQENNAKILTLDADENGISISSLENICQQKSIAFVYLSPTNNYPNNTNLSNQRKQQIKQLAFKYKFLIIEEDNHYEFYYTSRAQTPLSAHHYEGNSIYISSLGENLPPGFQISYIVAPSDLIHELKKLQLLYEPTMDHLMQYTIAELLVEGEISKFYRKNRKIYKEKLDILVNLLENKFGKKIKITLPVNGFGLWIDWQIPINLLKLKNDAANFQLYIPNDLLYQTKKYCGMRIGFASLQLDEMIKIVNILDKCVNMQIKKTSLK